MNGRMTWRFGLIVLGMGVALAALLAVVFLVDSRKRAGALHAGAAVVMTDLGPVEVARRGAGFPILVIHGAGGGYDQGLLLAEAFGGGGFDWVAPSRFGYLRSPSPADASTAAQADAFAALLDELGLDRVGVLAMSGGVPPALQLAQRHPARVTSLVLLSSAPFTPFTAGDQELPVPIGVYNALFASDFPYWLLRRLAPGLIAPMFDVGQERRENLTAEEMAFVNAMMEAFDPVTARVDGLKNEGAAIDPAAHYDLSAIAAPTLIVHAQDDSLNPVIVARALGEGLPNADLLILPDGGHLLLGHHGTIRAKVGAILSATALQSGTPRG